MNRPYLVVVAGGTASGKTTAAAGAAARMGALLIHHDRYYKDILNPRGHNFDHPDALDTDRLVADLARLQAGLPADLPIYEFKHHRRLAETERVAPLPLILVEGILTLSDPRLVTMADLRVFVDAPADIRLARRVRRDVAERGRDVGGVLDQYLATVRPMHEQFVEPARGVADLLLNGTAPIDLVIQSLIHAVDAGWSTKNGLVRS